jgi:hypothetical protein
LGFIFSLGKAIANFSDNNMIAVFSSSAYKLNTISKVFYMKIFYTFALLLSFLVYAEDDSILLDSKNWISYEKATKTEKLKENLPLLAHLLKQVYADKSGDIRVFNLKNDTLGTGHFGWDIYERRATIYEPGETAPNWGYSSSSSSHSQKRPDGNLEESKRFEDGAEIQFIENKKQQNIYYAPVDVKAPNKMVLERFPKDPREGKEISYFTVVEVIPANGKEPEKLRLTEYRLDKETKKVRKLSEEVLEKSEVARAKLKRHSLSPEYRGDQKIDWKLANEPVLDSLAAGLPFIHYRLEAKTPGQKEGLADLEAKLTSNIDQKLHDQYFGNNEELLKKLNIYSKAIPKAEALHESWRKKLAPEVEQRKMANEKYSKALDDSILIGKCKSGLPGIQKNALQWWEKNQVELIKFSKTIRSFEGFLLGLENEGVMLPEKIKNSIEMQRRATEEDAKNLEKINEIIKQSKESAKKTPAMNRLAAVLAKEAIDHLQRREIFNSLEKIKSSIESADHHLTNSKEKPDLIEVKKKLFATVLKKLDELESRRDKLISEHKKNQLKTFNIDQWSSVTLEKCLAKSKESISGQRWPDDLLSWLPNMFEIDLDQIVAEKEKAVAEAKAQDKGESFEEKLFDRVSYEVRFLKLHQEWAENDIKQKLANKKTAIKIAEQLFPSFYFDNKYAYPLVREKEKGKTYLIDIVDRENLNPMQSLTLTFEKDAAGKPTAVTIAGLGHLKSPPFKDIPLVDGRFDKRETLNPFAALKDINEIQKRLDKGEKIGPAPRNTIHETITPAHNFHSHFEEIKTLKDMASYKDIENFLKADLSDVKLAHLPYYTNRNKEIGDALAFVLQGNDDAYKSFFSNILTNDQERKIAERYLNSRTLYSFLPLELIDKEFPDLIVHEATHLQQKRGLVNPRPPLTGKENFEKLLPKFIEQKRKSASYKKSLQIYLDANEHRASDSKLSKEETQKFLQKEFETQTFGKNFGKIKYLWRKNWDYVTSPLEDQAWRNQIQFLKQSKKMSIEDIQVHLQRLGGMTGDSVLDVITNEKIKEWYEN